MGLVGCPRTLKECRPRREVCFLNERKERKKSLLLEEKWVRCGRKKGGEMKVVTD